MAVLKVRGTSSWVTAIAKAWSGSTWIEKLNFFDGSVWVKLYIADLAVNVTPSNLTEADGNCPFTSSAVSAAASGGQPSYSYSWTWQSGGSGITINSPTSLSTTLTINSTGLKTGTLRCIVTDQVPTNVQDTCSVALECGGA